MIDFNNFNENISDEILAAYIDGNATESEKLLIENALSGDSMLSEAVDIANDANSYGSAFGWDFLEDDCDLIESKDSAFSFEGNREDSETVNNGTNKMFAVYGDDALNEVSENVKQSYPDTCAIKSQQLVLENFGIHISEEQLRAEAIEHGWYSPGSGTPMADVGKLLELHGVGVKQYVNGNIYNVLNELAQGHNVIMGIDSGELWHYGLKEKIEDYIPGIGGADHALIVSGINTENPKDVKIIVTDPGTGDLCKEYPIAQFVDAAKDSNFYMVTTEESVPNVFDVYGEGIDHLPIIGNMTYDYFLKNYAFINDISNRSIFNEFYSHIQESLDIPLHQDSNIISTEPDYLSEGNDDEDFDNEDPDFEDFDDIDF